MNLSFDKNIAEPYINGTLYRMTSNNNFLFIIVLYSVIALVSSVGNSLVLVVVYRNENKRMRTTINFFIVSKSCSDLLITFCNIPFQISTYTTGYLNPFSGIMGIVYCKVTVFFYYLSIEMSLLNLAAIAVDRFIAVFYPFKKFFTNRSAKIVIGVMWLVGTLFNIPLVIKSTLFENKDQYFRFCAFTFLLDDLRVFMITFFIAFIVLPLLTMVILYSSIVVKLFQQKAPGENSTINREQRYRRNRKVLVMVVVVISFTIVCWLPFFSVYVDCLMTFPAFSCKSIPYLQILAFANCALNPCLYVVFHDNFRSGLYALFRAAFRLNICNDVLVWQTVLAMILVFRYTLVINYMLV